MADWIESQLEDSKRRFEALPEWLKEDYGIKEGEVSEETQEENNELLVV